MYRRAGLILFSAALLGIVSVSAGTFASAEACPAGFHPAAANEVPGVAAGTCTQDGGSVTAITNGGCDFNPYPYLEQFKVGSNILITPNGSGNSLQDGINPSLACRLAKFFKDMQAQGCIFKIESGYRSEATQARTCASICGNPGGCTGGAKCGAPGASCHQYGLAVDLSGPCMERAHQMLGVGSVGQGGQQYGIFFPMTGDQVHVQCIEDRVGYCNPNSPKCDGNVNISSSQGPYTPTSGLANQIRQSLGMPQQAPPPPPPQQSAPSATPSTSATPSSSSNGSATPCTPSYSCVGGTYYYQTSSCSTIPIQKCAGGCDASGSACAASSTSATGVGSAFATSTTDTNTNTNTNTNSNGTSAYDLIGQYANPVSNSISTDIGTATQIALNGDLNSAVIAYGEQPTDTSGQYGADRSVPLIPSSGVQQTFTSNDLANTPGTYQAGGNTSYLIQVWTTIRDSLVYILQSLRPFGHGSQQIQTMTVGAE